MDLNQELEYVSVARDRAEARVKDLEAINQYHHDQVFYLTEDIRKLELKVALLSAKG